MLFWVRFFLIYIFTTWFGLLFQHKYNRAWDKTLGKLLDENDGIVTDYTIHLGNVEVWISNRVYSFGNLWDYSLTESHRPGFYTMGRLLQRVEKLQNLNEMEKESKITEKYKQIK